MADGKKVTTKIEVEGIDSASPAINRAIGSFKKLEAQSKKDYSKGLEAIGNAASKAYTAYKSYKVAVDELSRANSELVKHQTTYYNSASKIIPLQETHNIYLKQEKELIDKVTAARQKLNTVSIPAAWKSNIQATSSKNTSNINTKSNNSNNENISSGFIGLAGASSVLMAGKEIIIMADNYKMLQSRISLASASTAEYTQANKDLLAIANTNGQSLEATALLYNRIRQGIKDLGGTYEDAKSSVSAVSAALRISGASAIEAYSAQLQFSQALASGKLRGDELRSIMENAPALAKAIANGLKVPIGKLYELGEAGSLSTKMVIDALKTQESELTKQASQLSLTIGQSFQVLKNNMETYIGTVDQSIGLTSKLSKVILGIGNNMEYILPIATGLGAAIGILALNAARLAIIPMILNPVSAIVGTIAVGVGVLAGGFTAMGSSGKSGIDALRKELSDFDKDLEKIIAKGTISERLNARDDANLQNTDLQRRIEDSINAQKRLQLDLDYSENPFQKRAYQNAINREQERLNVLTKAKIDNQRKLYELEQSMNANSDASILDMRSKFGLDTKASTGGSLVNKSSVEQLAMLPKLFEAYSNQVKDNSGNLASSFSEVSYAFEKMVEDVTDSAFGQILDKQLEELSSKSTGAMKDAINIERDKLSSKIEELQNKEIKDSVSFLTERVSALKDAQSSILDNNKLLLQNSIDFKLVMAELKLNAREFNSLSLDSSKLSTRFDKSKYTAEIAAIDELSKAKIKSIEVDKEARLDSLVNERIKLDKERQKELDNINRKNNANLTAIDETSVAGQSYNDKYASLYKQRVAVAQNAASSIKLIERETLAEKIKALTTYRDSLVSKSSEALQSYKSFAQKVIDLDKQIRDNRINTANDIENIKRKGMSTGQLQDSYRSEYDKYGNLAQQYSSSQDYDKAKEYLQKQREVANNLAGSSDSKAIQDEAISMLEEVGNKTEQILQTERETAASAAADQMALYEELNSTIQKLAEQITSLNENSVINLKAKLDESAIQGVIQSIQDALNSRTFTFNAVASNVSVDGNRTAGYATGGFISGPGTGTSDSIPIMASNGEYMIRAAAVRKFGVGFFNAINHGMHVPRFATGGLIGAVGAGGGSVNNYIQMPGGGYEKVPTSSSEIDSFQSKLARERLKYGKR